MRQDSVCKPLHLVLNQPILSYSSKIVSATEGKRIATSTELPPQLTHEAPRLPRLLGADAEVVLVLLESAPQPLNVVGKLGDLDALVGDGLRELADADVGQVLGLPEVVQCVLLVVDLGLQLGQPATELGGDVLLARAAPLQLRDLVLQTAGLVVGGAEVVLERAVRRVRGPLPLDQGRPVV